MRPSWIVWICRFKSCAIEFSFVWQHQQNNGSQILQSYSLQSFLVDFLRLDINWKFFFAKFQLVVHKIGRACQTKQFGRAPVGQLRNWVRLRWAAPVSIALISQFLEHSESQLCSLYALPKLCKIWHTCLQNKFFWENWASWYFDVLCINDSNTEKEENMKNFLKIKAIYCFITRTMYSHFAKNILLHFVWVFL